MKTTALILLLSLGSCTTVERVGEWICGNVETVQSGVNKVGDFFGTPGNLIAGGLNILVNAGCQLIGITASVPADVARDIGLMEAEGETAPSDAAPSSDPSR